MQSSDVTVGLLVSATSEGAWKRFADAAARLGCDVLLLRLPLFPPRRESFFSAYTMLDRVLSGVSPCSSRRDARLAAVPAVDLPAADWTAALTRSIREHGLDLLVVAGRVDLPLEVLAALPSGAVSLDYLDFATGRMPEAFAAVVDGWQQWEPRLVWHLAGCGQRLLWHSPSAVFPLSLHQTAEPAAAKMAAALERVLGELVRDGLDAWEKRALPMGPAAVVPIPDNRTMLRLLPRLLGRQLAGAVQNLLLRPQWFLAVRRGGGDPFDARGYEPLYPSPAHGWADPFPVVHEGRVYLFIEDIDMATGRGRIAVMPGRDEGGFEAPRLVLSKPWHLSYPFVFAWEGDMYMLPESSGSGQVTLYRARCFPDDWEPVATLLDDVRAVDATVFAHDGAWWMLVNQRVPGGSSWDELFVYRADSPLGPFRPHPANPVVSDVTRARPGGRVFVRDGRLLRPAQDCSGHYGRALVLCEIEELTATTYRERVVARHKADVLPASDSLHTYNAVPGLETVDGRRFIARWRLPWGRR